MTHDDCRRLDMQLPGCYSLQPIMSALNACHCTRATVPCRVTCNDLVIMRQETVPA